MNAQSKFALKATPRQKAHLAEVERLCDRLKALRDTLRVTDGRYDFRADWELLDVLESLPLAFPDIDVSGQLDDLRHDLRIDEEGYKLNSDGDATDHRIHTPAEKAA